MCADQLHGERLLCSLYVQDGAPVASPTEQMSEQTTRMGGTSIKEVSAVLNTFTTKSLDIGQHQLELHLVSGMACSCTLSCYLPSCVQHQLGMHTVACAHCFCIMRQVPVPFSHMSGYLAQAMPCCYALCNLPWSVLCVAS